MTLQELIDNYGLDQIRDRTRISVDNILNLLNEDYESCGKTNALGFYKILEREFDIDFSAQKETLRQHINEPHYVPKELLVTERKYASTKKITSVALFLMFLAVAAVAIVFYANKSNTSTQAVSDQTSNQQEIADTQEKLDIQKFNNVEKNSQGEQQSNASKEENITKPLDEPTDDTTAQQSISTNPDDDANTSKVAEVPVVSEPEPTQKTESPVIEAPKVLNTYQLQTQPVVSPKSKVWLGYIDLENGKRVQKNKTGEIPIEGNNTLIVTGHGHLEISGIDFATGQRLFFEYEAGELKRLNEAAFRQRNEGRLW